MLDTFLFEHKRVQLSKHGEVVRDSLFQIEIPMLNRLTVNNYWDPVLEKTWMAQVYEKVFELAVHEMTRDLLYRNFSELTLLEVIALHRIQMELIAVETPQSPEGRAVAVLGAMIQQRLALYLACTSLNSVSSAYGVGKFPNINRNEWEKAFAGAASMAKAMKAWQKIKGLQMYLASIHEDVDHGVDLFLLYQDILFGISLKTGTDPLTWAELVEREERDNPNPTQRTKERNAVFCGVRKFGHRTHYYVWPVLACIGKPTGRRYDVIARESDTQPLLDIFQHMLARNRTPNNECGREQAQLI